MRFSLLVFIAKTFTSLCILDFNFDIDVLCMVVHVWFVFNFILVSECFLSIAVYWVCNSECFGFITSLFLILWCTGYLHLKVFIFEHYRHLRGYVYIYMFIGLWPFQFRFTIVLAWFAWGRLWAVRCSVLHLCNDLSLCMLDLIFLIGVSCMYVCMFCIQFHSSFWLLL